MKIEQNKKKWEKPELTVISMGEASESVLSFSDPPPPPGLPGGPTN